MFIYSVLLYQIKGRPVKMVTTDRRRIIVILIFESIQLADMLRCMSFSEYACARR